MPFIMASGFAKLYFTTMTNYQKTFFQVGLNHSGQRVLPIQQCGCLFGTFNWRVTTLVERGWSLWYIFGGKVHPKSYVHLEHTWLSYPQPICWLCDERACGMPTMWSSYKILFFKKKLKLVYCGSHRYLPRTHPYWRVQTTFNGKTKNRVALMKVSIANIQLNGL